MHRLREYLIISYNFCLQINIPLLTHLLFSIPTSLPSRIDRVISNQGNAHTFKCGIPIELTNRFHQLQIKTTPSPEILDLLVFNPGIREQFLEAARSESRGSASINECLPPPPSAIV